MGNSSSQTDGPESKHFEQTLATLPTSLAGKVYAVTGCTSGTGLVLACVLADRGGRVFLLNRPSSRAEAALQRVRDAAGDGNADNITHIDCDLMDFDSVRAAADKLREATPELDVLVNNAGIMAFRDIATKDGYDVQMQTNHLSHFLLTARVWPLLEAAAAARGDARVVQHSSIARTRAKGLNEANLGKNGGNLGGDSVGFIPGSGPLWDRYSQTKLANVAFALALRDRIAAAGPDSPSAKILSLVAHPGVAYSGLASATESDSGGLGWVGRKLIPLMQQSTEDGALGIVRCAIDNGIPTGSLVGPTGRKGPAVVMDAATEEARVPPEQRDMLWRLSCEATGVTDFFPSA